MAALTQSLESFLERKGKKLDNLHQRILLKEVLQSYVLSFLYNHKEYRHLNFYGGTCLRVLFGLNRMSEDIDLDNSKGVDIALLEKDLISYFKNAVGTRTIFSSLQSGRSNIFRITLKLPILYDLNLSNHINENLHLKIEISQHKQNSIIHKTPVVYYGKSFVPSHFSLESMFSGKILACLERSFQEGKSGADFKARDFYDLIWIMQQEIEPEREKLIHDGKQSYEIRDAFLLLEEKVNLISVQNLKNGLIPLFEDQNFIDAWCEVFHETFARLKEKYQNN